jgi:hypothetical protein
MMIVEGHIYGTPINFVQGIDKEDELALELFFDFHCIAKLYKVDFKDRYRYQEDKTVGYSITYTNPRFINFNRY